VELHIYVHASFGLQQPLNQSQIVVWPETKCLMQQLLAQNAGYGLVLYIYRLYVKLDNETRGTTWGLRATKSSKFPGLSSLSTLLS